MPEITIDPVSRVEGHLQVKVELDDAGTVTAARVVGNLFRDFENILRGRHPWDAVALTQRICGVCPVSHAVTSTKAIESIQGFTPGTQALLLRALIQGSNYLQDHVLHFYHLSLMDYVAGPAMSPWAGKTPDMRFSAAQTDTLVQHYVQALNIRRKAQEMGAILAGRIPHVASILPGGVTMTPTRANITRFGEYLAEITSFVRDVYLPDAHLLASVYPDYHEIGVGSSNFMSVGSFDLPGGAKLFPSGLIIDGRPAGRPDLSRVREFVGGSFYASSSGMSPAEGVTVPDLDKPGAYSWLKAPRYDGRVIEVGPLARMRVAGRITGQSSVMNRVLARAHETALIAAAMKTWLAQVAPGVKALATLEPKVSGGSIGYTEAPRGTLAHWLQYSNRAVTRYQIITPTCWNGSPVDDSGQNGALEQALKGVHVSDATNPVELVRIVHSFDPCIGCAVHVTTADRRFHEVTAIR